ncbi:MAG: hypothetical protein HYY64_14015 [Candidatus Rokubacteria bacterium]|nr:hypothetical protein [Candidatus Rokubacteria bacterium]
MWNRIASWRFALLIGLTVLDAVVFVMPLVPLALIVAAVAAPHALRGVARFLEALADGR